MIGAFSFHHGKDRYIVLTDWDHTSTCGQHFQSLIDTWMFPKIVVHPKSSILIGFSIINHPFWGILGAHPYFWKHPLVTLIWFSPFLLVQSIQQERCHNILAQISGPQGCQKDDVTSTLKEDGVAQENVQKVWCEVKIGF